MVTLSLSLDSEMLDHKSRADGICTQGMLTSGPQYQNTLIA
jgi:hypothetical protein